MEELAALIYNFNTNCYKQYTNVSNLLGNKLYNVLTNIERFYYSDFYESRFIKRLREEGFRYYPIELDCILGTISELKDNTQFKMFNEDSSLDGQSDSKFMIALNVNLDKDELNDSHITNVIMHEFGHRQYNQQEFRFIKYLNRLIIGTPETKESLNKED